MNDGRLRAALAAIAVGLLAGSAAAHGGHGVDGMHWHAWDLGLLALALAVVGGLLWWRRGGR
jgi:uncharacterized membrane protein